MQGIETLAKNADSLSSDTVGLPTLFWRQRLDELLLLEPSDRAVEGARTKASAAEKKDIFNHRVTVLRTSDETREDK
jgi:hypothetical protein